MKIMLFITTIMALIASTATISSFADPPSSPYPLILIPGNGGNQLEARLTERYKPTSVWCSRWYPLIKDSEGWFRLWFDPSVLFAPFTECFSERMRLYYDVEKDDYYNARGVKTRVSGFGSTQSLLYLDPHLKHISAYMAPLVQSLEQIGYIDGKNLYGAPYDFRYGLAAEGHPSHVGSKFLTDLKNLVEEVSASNGGNPVILLSHSLGGLFVLQLLKRNSVSWGENYIKHFIALSAPWGGTVDEMLTFASGNTLGVPLVDPLLVRDEQRSSESNLWLMPSPIVFNKTKPLVITPDASYSAHDITQFLQDIGFSEGVYPYETRILPLVKDLTVPAEVPITCIIGTGVKTPETLFYGKGGFDEGPEIVYGDGDGTVNMVSLLALESNWTDEQNGTLKVIKIPGVSHMSILKDDCAINEIIKQITSVNSAVSIH